MWSPRPTLFARRGAPTWGAPTNRSLRLAWGPCSKSEANHRPSPVACPLLSAGHGVHRSNPGPGHRPSWTAGALVSAGHGVHRSNRIGRGRPLVPAPVVEEVQGGAVALADLVATDLERGRHHGVLGGEGLA